VSEPFRPVDGPCAQSVVLAELARLWDQAQHHTAGKGPRLTPARLARESNVPGSTVSSWANGTALPREAGQLDKVGKVLARLAREPAPELKTWEQLLEADQAARQVHVPAGSGPGRLISELDDPFALEVHRPVVVESGGATLALLPPYVRRGHDEDLAAVVAKAAEGRSAVAVLVGGSSTGKTRACWEAAHQLPAGWRLWHPFDPARPEALLTDLPQVGPRTVIWLNETQLYLTATGDTGERVAAALRTLASDPARAPVLIVGTLWPQYWDTLTRAGDEHSQARALLDGTAIPVPSAFTGTAMADLQKAASTDPRLAAAAAAADGQVAQYLAGVPALLDRYRNAPPAAQALIHAAMDARRLGHGVALPLSLLEAAAPAYLSGNEWDALGDDWLEQALAYLAERCKGVSGPLLRIRAHPDESLAGTRPGSDGPAYRLADYLDQHGRRHRADMVPPAGFWAAACRHARPGDQETLSKAASGCGLYRVDAQLCKNATTATGNATTAARLVILMYAVDPAERQAAQWAATSARLDDPGDVAFLLGRLREAGADRQVTTLLDRDPAASVALDDPYAVASLLDALRGAAASAQVMTLAERAAASVALDDPDTMAFLLGRLREAGAGRQVTALLDRDPAASVGLEDPDAVGRLLGELQEAGASAQVTTLAERAAASIGLDDPYGVGRLLGELQEAGASAQVTTLAERAAASIALDDPYGVAFLLGVLREAGAGAQVTVLAERAAASADLDDPVGVGRLMGRLREKGAGAQVTALAERAAASVALDDPYGVAFLLGRLREAGASQQIATLLDRDPAASVALDDPESVAILLGELREAGAGAQVTALAERAAAAAAFLDDPYDLAILLGKLWDNPQVTTLAERAAASAALDDPGAVAFLLGELREAGASQQIATLLDRDPAARVALDHPYGVTSLLDGLREAGASQQIATLLDRDPAASVALDDSDAVADLLDRLREAGAGQQMTALAERAAASADLDDPVGVARLMGRLRKAGASAQVTALAERAAASVALDDPPAVVVLLNSMREAGASQQVAILRARLPLAGMFGLGGVSPQFRFGRELNGAPAKRWGWVDLS
jgi:uncharacterized protein YidB (DUF937 family)